MRNNKKHEVKIVESRLPVGDMRKTKTDYSIPTFGYKSAFIIMGAAVLSTVILPLLLAEVGVPFNLVAILANTFITSYAVAYSRYFIESKKGYCKKFWITYLIFVFSCFFIGFFWVSMNTYI